MTIVYSKTGCKLCNAAKEKLEMMGISYRTVDLEAAPPENWRENGAVEAMAAYQEWETLPIIRIEDEYHNYPSAMRRIKKMRQRETTETARAVAV